jgi:hypothetical protein
MALPSRTRAFFFALWLVAFAAPAAHAAVLGATEIDGKQAPTLRKVRTSTIRVYAFTGKTARPIPFQVDERDHRNRWVIDRGPEPNRDDTPGVFDENDAVVFLNRDLGTNGLASALPAGAQRWLEVRIGEPSRPLGFVYIGVFAKPPPVAPDPNYVRYDWGLDRVFGQRYAVGFNGPLPNHIAFVDRLGDWGENRLTAVRARGEARLFGGLITIQRDESAIEVEREGYRTGPVRAIRRGNYWIRLPLGVRARGRVDLLFYPDFVAVRAVAKIKIPPSLVPGDGEMTAAFDFRGLDGSRLVLDGVTADGTVDGTMSENEKKLRNREGRWGALLLPGHDAFVLAVDLEGALRRLEQRLVYDDGDAGRRPRLGFALSKVSRLETGEHPLNVVGYVLDDHKRAGEAAAAVLSPPAVSVKAIFEAAGKPERSPATTP